MPALGLARRLLPVLAGLTFAAVAYLVGLTVAAAAGRRRPSSPAEPAASLSWLILIPAHDEARGLGATLDAIARLDHPPELRRVVVVADHCEDATATVAVRHGAEVLERRGGRRGKGAALAWALERLRAPGADHEAVLFLDADCAPSANLIWALERRMRAGARAVQASYVVANPTESRASALRFAGFALINTVRPWGKDVLGLSAGILGSGFAVDRETVDSLGWNAFSLTEDTEYHLKLLYAGVRVEFAAEASVSSAMPTSLEAARTQNARWESGKLQMWRGRAARLLVDGARRRDPQLVHAAVEGVVPPQSALAATVAVLTATGATMRNPTVTRLGLACAAGQALHVLGGLWLVRAPGAVYRALASAPLLVAWKLLLYARMLAGRVPRSWERTTR
jgi:hypothetical protein